VNMCCLISSRRPVVRFVFGHVAGHGLLRSPPPPLQNFLSKEIGSRHPDGSGQLGASAAEEIGSGL
jgi:hypothetical protein